MANYTEKPKRKGPKKKSIKAPIHSRMDPKRKISRMGKKRQKHKGGLDAIFISRTQCLKKLQITLKDFRRLCILKGIYPRQPRGNKSPHNKKGQVFYHLKDVRAIAHEPVLDKFRTFKSFMKKIRKNVIQENVSEAQLKYQKEMKNGYTLHHLVKERYPRFLDAMNDIDDALTLTFLYASLPSSGKIKSSITRKAKDIASAWGAYCAINNCITKSFISIKGVYVEAKILNHNVRWIVPHSFTQRLPKDVDYKVMSTFFEFYECLLDFVLFKLYNDMGVKYPFSNVDNLVTLGSSSTLLSAYLQTLTKVFRNRNSDITNVITAATEQQQQDNIMSIDDDSNNETKTNEVLQATKVLPNILNDDKSKTDEEMKNVSDDEEDDDDEDNNENVDSIVNPLKAALQSVSQEDNATINHNVDDIIDEESLKRKKLFSGLVFFLSREVPRGYLEIIILSYGGKVGWESDDSTIGIKDKSITHHILDRPKDMIPPKYFDNLPKNREFIQPQWVLDSSNFLLRLPPSKYALGVSLPPHLSPWVNDEEEGYKPKYREDIEKLKNGEMIEEEEEHDNFVETEKKDVAEAAEQAIKDDSDPTDGVESKEESENEEDDDEEEDESKIISSKKKEEEENKALAKLMMSKKAKRLYGRMQHGIQGKQKVVEDLERKRKEVDITRKDKSSLKQKVERLKDDRKIIEKEYQASTGSMKKNKKKRVKK